MCTWPARTKAYSATVLCVGLAYDDNGGGVQHELESFACYTGAHATDTRVPVHLGRGQRRDGHRIDRISMDPKSGVVLFVRFPLSGFDTCCSVARAPRCVYCATFCRTKQRLREIACFERMLTGESAG